MYRTLEITYKSCDVPSESVIVFYASWLRAEENTQQKYEV